MGEPKTRILFTENGKPVEGLSVRARDEDDPVETDADGQVAVPLLEGRQTLRILKEGEWIPQIVQTNRESSLIVVDLAKRETGEFVKPPDPDTSFLDIGKLNLGERYVYQEIIGRGGMSVVLRAHDRLLNREVAVKVLSQELQAQPEAQQIFLTEARNLATLSHPNLVSVHDICKVDEQVFMVIEYVEGESLEKLVNAVRGFNETVALQTVIQLARVVGYLHDHEIIHRDIKPANAMLRNDGTVKLIDFGLARHFDDLQIRGTRVRGTPAYMSPEQITGDSLTPACDVYQLGVCLFEALTGRLPFSSKGDMGYQHVHKEAPSVHEYRPHVSDELAELLNECLAKDPNARPQNGQELLRRLQVIYQQSGSAGTNLYQQLQQDAKKESHEIEREGYTTSELRLMEGAGKHLHTSDFSVQTLNDILSDPNNQSRIVIQTGPTGPRWPAILGACLVTSTLGAGLMYAMMTFGALEPAPQLPEPTAVTAELDREPAEQPKNDTEPSPTPIAEPTPVDDIVVEPIETTPEGTAAVPSEVAVAEHVRPTATSSELVRTAPPTDSKPKVIVENKPTTESGTPTANNDSVPTSTLEPDPPSTDATDPVGVEVAVEEVAEKPKPKPSQNQAKARKPTAKERKEAKRSGLFAPKKKLAPVD